MVRLKDVADACGVSKATASKALRGYPDVSAVTRARIRITAARMGYDMADPDKKLMALNRCMGLYLTGGRSSVLLDPAFVSFQRGFFDRTAAEHFDMTLLTPGPDPGMGSALTARALRRGLDGICVFCTGGIPAIVTDLTGGTFPSVAAGARIPGAFSVLCDDEGGLSMLIRKALRAGRKRFCLLYGEDQIHTLLWKKTFEEVLAGKGLAADPLYLSCSQGLRTSAEVEVRTLVEEGTLPDCILCTDSALAAGSMLTLTGAGIRVPDQVSVACLGDDLARHGGGYQITTAFRDMDRMGEKAADLLLERIHLQMGAPRTSLVLEELYFPGTTGGF